MAMVASHSTIIVHAKLAGFLKVLAERDQFELEVKPGSTVDKLLELVVERSGDALRRAVQDGRGKLHGGVEVVLNGEQVPAHKLGEISVWDDCDLLFLPIVGGG